MKIIEIHAMRGPNYWSNFRKKLIVMKLDLEQLEELPTNKIPGFSERLEKLFPTMITHRCSKEYEGGFLNALKMAPGWHM
jgi:cyanophycin synthetase